jgi:hypothetical protein
MQAIQSSLTLAVYQQELVDVLQCSDCSVFLDTNLLAWAFRLNDTASLEFQQWLDELARLERLIIPAWAVHEYNHHLLRNDPKFFFPHKAVSKQLSVNLEELDRVVHLMTSDYSAREFEYENRDKFIEAFSDTSKTIKKCMDQLDKNYIQRRNDLIIFFEELIAKCALRSDVHELADAVAREAPARYVNRLSPGYNDSKNPENSNGDLIIWKEILDYCKSKDIKKAVFITNDCKSDWVYTPPNLILPNGSLISGTNVKARLVKLPKPDLIAEFERYTGSKHFHIFSSESVINGLSSEELNHSRAQDFRHLASAIKLDLAQTSTEKVVQWFQENTDKYHEAIHGVCCWRQSPSEVDLDVFKTWTVEEMRDIEAQKVRWGEVFCQLFL